MDSPKQLRIQSAAVEIASEIAGIVAQWSFFHQQTLGIQIVKAADSISNNIGEGYGRATTADRIHFMLIAEGSLREVKNQVQLASQRGVIEDAKAQELDQLLLRLSIGIIEFCYSLLEQDTEYRGRYRESIPARMWWRKKNKDSPNQPT